MSDVSGVGSGTSGVMVSQIVASVTVDTSQATQVVQQLGQLLARTGQQASSSGQGFSVMGSSIAMASAQGLNGLQALGNSGATFLQPVNQVLGGMGNFLYQLAIPQAQARDGFEKLAQSGMKLQAIGGIIASIGFGLQALSAPLQKANADLTTALKNANVNSSTIDAGGVSTYGKDIDSLVSSGQKLGISQDQVKQSVASLIPIFGSVDEAIKAYETSIVMSKEANGGLGESISEATTQLERGLAGNTRGISQFEGVDKLKTIPDAAKEATAAQNELAKGTKALTDAQTNYADESARVQQSIETRTAQWSQKVQADTEAVTKAQEAASAAQQKVSVDDVTALADWQTKSTDAAQTTSDAQEHLADTYAEQSARIQDAIRQRTQSELDAATSVGNAQTHLQQLMEMHTVTGPGKTAQQQLQYQFDVANAQKAVRDAQEKQDYLTSTPLQSQSQTISDAQTLKTAQESVTKALQNQQLVQEQGVKLQETISKDQQTLANDNLKMADAQQKLVVAQQNLAAAQVPTLAQAQQLDKLQGKITDAQDKIAKANADQAKATADQQAAITQMNTFMDQMATKFKGTVDAEADTLGGRMKALEAQLKNDMQNWGSNLMVPMQIIGTLGFALGGVVSIAGRGISFFKNLGKEAGDAATKVTDVGTNAAEATPELEGAAVVAGGIGAPEVLGGIAAVGVNIASIAAPLALVDDAIHKATGKWVIDFHTVTTTLFDPSNPSSLQSKAVNFGKHIWDMAFGGGGGKSQTDALVAEGQAMINTVLGKMNSDDSWTAAKTAGWNIGTNIDAGLVGGLQGSSAAVNAAATNVSNGALAAFSHALQLFSPSRKTMQMGEYIVEGLVVGMHSRMGDVTRGMEDIAGKVTLGGTKLSLPGMGAGMSGSPVVVNVNVPVAGSVIAERDLQASIRDSLVQQGFYAGGRYLGGKA